ncbi:hypothetical protein [Rhizobium leguminosarum]|uniref:Uncharacterized protein n=1 Tax=Rhizobium leguminosarum TaxID=384 RepID=A0A1B1C3X2_RHILE|nr:hypothetical protein [Rhizobium leguminosarum]ANP84462.1 hypothetical protein BA011_01035 [Rhizobium leguminosarum]
MRLLRPANDQLSDYTTTLEFLAGNLIAPGCSVILDEQQYPVLLAFLDRIAAIGDIKFRLEMCVDHRPGYSVSWDNDGSEEQDDEVDRLMGELVQSLGFDAGSIFKPGVIADPADILNAADRQDAARAILDKVPNAEPEDWDEMPKDK